MKLNGSAMALLAVFCLAIPLIVFCITVPTPGERYFPPALQRPAMLCDGYPRPSLQPYVDFGWRTILGSAWRAADERPLFHLNQGNGTKVYRFTSLPSFREPVIVRLEESKAGTVNMTTTVLAGQGGYPPWFMDRKRSRQLTPAEVAKFKAVLSAASLASLSPAVCDNYGDGVTWTFESNDGKQYLLVRRRTVMSGPLKTLGEAFLHLAGSA